MNALLIYIAIGALLTYVILWGTDWSDDPETDDDVTMVRESIANMDPIQQVGILLLCCVLLPVTCLYLAVHSLFE